MNTRSDIVRLLAANRETLSDDEALADLWRRNAEDLIAAGINRQDVAETMISVALAQGVLAHGATAMVGALRRQADWIEIAAEKHGEYPIANPFQH